MSRALMSDIPYRCDGCRKGHYEMASGGITNFPCTTDGCKCWFCGPVVTPAQAQARAHQATVRPEGSGEAEPPHA